MKIKGLILAALISTLTTMSFSQEAEVGKIKNQLLIFKKTDEQITTFNPTIGGEYIFGEHFSIGSEIGFPFAIANKDAAIGFGFNRLILRFYP